MLCSLCFFSGRFGLATLGRSLSFSPDRLTYKLARDCLTVALYSLLLGLVRAAERARCAFEVKFLALRVLFGLRLHP